MGIKNQVFALPSWATYVSSQEVFVSSSPYSWFKYGRAAAS